MILLPDRNIPRGRFLLPVRASEWRASSQALPKDQFGRDGRTTRFRLRARAHDGHVVWRGWFDDREDLDAFLWAIATGTLRRERALWRLPTPEWHPDLGEGLSYDFVTVTTLTSPTGTNQTYSRPTDWNASNNSVGCIGGGGSAFSGQSPSQGGSGGGGGASARTFNLAIGASVTYRIGAVVGDSWFNGTAVIGSSVGAKAGSSAGSRLSGGVGGSSTNSVGDVKNAGSGGGSATPGSMSGAGGGWAGSATWEGTGYAGSGGNGAAGGSALFLNGQSGNLYGGGGGGGGAYASGDGPGGGGAQGIVVVIYTPATIGLGNMAMMGM